MFIPPQIMDKYEQLMKFIGFDPSTYYIYIMYYIYYITYIYMHYYCYIYMYIIIINYIYNIINSY